MFLVKKWLILSLITIGFSTSLAVAETAIPQRENPENAQLLDEKATQYLKTLHQYASQYLPATMKRLEIEISQTTDLKKKRALIDEISTYALHIDTPENIERYASMLQELSGNDEDHILYAEINSLYAKALNGNNTASARLEEISHQALTEGNIEIIVHTAIINGLLGPQNNSALDSLQRLYSSLALVESQHDVALQKLSIYWTISFLNASLNDFEGTIDFYNLALDLAINNNLAIDAASSLFNIALALQNVDHIDLARRFFNEYRSINLEANQLMTNSRYYGAMIFLEWDARNFERVVQIADQGLNINLIEPQTKATLYYGKLTALSRLGQKQVFNQTWQEYLNFIDEHANTEGIDWLKNNLRMQSEQANIAGDHEKAYNLINDHYLDLLYDLRHAQAMSARGMTNGIEDMLNRIRAEKELNESQLTNQRLITLSTMILLFSTTIFIIFQYRQSKELADSKLKADQANELKGHFVANVSHELRTPLNSIIGFSEIIANQTAGKIDNEEYVEFARIIHQSGEHLLAIVNDILDMNKIEAGFMTINPAPIHIKEQVENVFSLLQGKADERHMTLSQAIGENAPLLSADPRMFRQILINLVNNAIKFSGNNTAIHIYIDVGNTDVYRVIIRDNGVGMTAEQIELARQPFTQIENSASRSQEGTGLGLPLVERFMRLHSGTLDIYSAPNKGTKITLTFPRNETD